MPKVSKSHPLPENKIPKQKHLIFIYIKLTVENIRRTNVSFTMKRFDLLIKKHSTNPIKTAFIVLLGIVLILAPFSIYYYIKEGEPFLRDILIEAHGIIFDIAIIGILILWLNKLSDRTQRIKEYLNEIEDFRNWQSPEAAFRVAGNVKRLSKEGVTGLHLSHYYLANTNMGYLDLKGCNFNYSNMKNVTLDSSQLNDCRFNQTSLVKVNGNNANLENSLLCGADMENSYFVNCDFRKTLLMKANLNDAFFINCDLRDANLTEATLENTNLYKADLRGATGLTIEQLSKVRSLYKARFDETLEARVKAEIGHLLTEIRH